MRHALAWIHAFLAGQEGALIRRILVESKAGLSTTQVVCDASPWGLGAVLVRNDEIVSWLAVALVQTDLDVLGIERGDCRGQAVVEALCIAVALRTWAPDWRDEPTVLMARSDAMAALGAINKTSSPNPAMNRVVREVALDLSEGSYELDILGHIPAVWNTVTDALSRLEAPPPDTHEIPGILANVPRAHPAPRTLQWWRTVAAPRGQVGVGAEAEDFYSEVVQ